MDVVSTLAQLRVLAAMVLSEDSDDMPYGEQMAELFNALDAWMKSGGFSPWEIELRESLHNGNVPPAVFMAAE